MASENESSVEKRQDNVIVSHCNIIEPIFWKAHPGILDEKPCIHTTKQWCNSI